MVGKGRIKSGSAGKYAKGKMTIGALGEIGGMGMVSAMGAATTRTGAGSMVVGFKAADS